VTFDGFKREVLAASLVCGRAEGAMLVAMEPRRSSRLIAAAALVVRDKGAQWVIDAFRKRLFKYLGWIASLALMFGGGGPLIVIARLLIPIIVEVLQRQFSVAGASSMSIDFDAMAGEARRVLKG
jgi:hypothetical protein